MAKKPTPTKATKPNTLPKFRIAQRHAVTVNGGLVETWPEQKDARDFARMLYADDKGYKNALRRGEVAVIKVDIRPAKK